MILNDKMIKKLGEKGMIEPFEPNLVRETYVPEEEPEKVISYGLSSFGYDIRVADEFEVFDPVGGIVDPKNPDTLTLRPVSGQGCVIIPPNSFALARSVEYFRMPADVLGDVKGKSTYARCGINTNVTPLEPGWEGHITLEIANQTPLPAKIYAGEGICQVVFYHGKRPSVTYEERQGKYQGQTGITRAMV